MTPQRAEDRVEHLVRMQREMSRSRSAEETAGEFLGLIASVSRADHIVYAADAPDAWRVALDSPLGESGVDPGVVAAMFTEAPGASPTVRGGLLAEIVASGPTIVADLRIDPDDPDLGHLAARARSLLSVPIFAEGAARGCCVMLAGRPDAFADEDLLVLLSSTNMLARSITHLATLERVAELAERREWQLRELARVQRSLLPAGTPAIRDYDIATSYKPSLHAGGDYYDFRVLPGDRLGVIIADVSGHGAAAAAVMAVMRTVMHVLSESGPEIGFVEPVNRLIRGSVSERMFVTACFVAIRPETGEVELVNCGHPPPRLRRASGDVVPIVGDGVPPLGIVEYDAIPRVTTRLDPGDSLMLHTDGVTEAFDDRRDMFGLERLDDAIRAGATARAVVESIESRVNEHAPIPDDDQAIVVIRRRNADG